MQYTSFIVRFDYFTYIGKKEHVYVEVRTLSKLDDELSCDDYVDSEKINTKYFYELNANSIENWEIISMSTHTDDEFSTRIVDAKINKKRTKVKRTKSKYKSLAVSTTNELVTLESTIKTSLSTCTNKIDFLKSIFGSGVDFMEPFEWNDVKHMYISSGSTRDVYVDPTWTYVIKVPSKETLGEHRLGNQFNAIEVWDYFDSKYDKHQLPKVESKLLSNTKGQILIVQDFLVVLNTSRGRINTLFDEVFTPTESMVTDIYGYQYGWNKRTQRIELYDTSDMYIGNNHIDNDFEASYDLFEEQFKDFEVFKKVHFYNSFVEYAKSAELWSKLLSIETKPECYLPHQEGLLFDYLNKSIHVCGTVFDSIQSELETVIEDFCNQYEYDETYFIANINRQTNLLTE